MNARTRIASASALVVLVTSAVFGIASAGQARGEPFPHERHAKVFPVCTTCHAGALDSARPIWPAATGCAACHDGTLEKRVSWQPRSGPRATNLRFTHAAHRRAAAEKLPADSIRIRSCSSCHTVTGTGRMSVRRTVVAQCIECHGLEAPHVENPAEACSTCHLRLTEAPTLTRTVIAGFPKPLTHEAADWLLGAHGRAAKGPGASTSSFAVSANCATCHSRDLCLTCHVNAPEVPAIRALALDDRPPARAGGQPVPASHRADGFLSMHGREARRANPSCAGCHTRESCTTCHVGPPPPVFASMPASGAGRARGAVLTRRPPANHTREFRSGHGPDANARPATCQNCHMRSTCLSCHRPEGARQAAYHPPEFVTRHPSAAYTREANCSDCHNPAQFCQACHRTSGIVAGGRLGRLGYHDAYRGFSLGHGQAARQSLESCASCHAERDCTACHSAVGSGYRFSPHGPGFDSERALAKNPSVCVACHGRVIPRR